MIGRLYALRDRMIGLSDKFGADVADIANDTRRSLVVRVLAGVLSSLLALGTLILLCASVVIGISLVITIMAYLIAWIQS